MTPTAVVAPARLHGRAVLIGVALGPVYVVWGSTYLAIQCRYPLPDGRIAGGRCPRWWRLHDEHEREQA
jgi:hypothetical protein